MKNILVIDDSLTIRKSVELTLKKLGHNIIEAENGAEALRQIDTLKEKGEKIALCITDMNMPVMNGMDFIEEFRKNDKFTPVIALTTESENEMIEKGRKAGATGWLVKPFKPESLVNVVNKLVK